MIAGIVFLKRKIISSGHECEFRNAIAQYNLKSPNNIYKIDNALFFRRNTGALTAYPGSIFNESVVSLLAGEPFITQKIVAEDHQILTTAIMNRDLKTLKNARGVFVAALYKQEENTLFLCSDKLGIRPLYYWHADNIVVFSTQLRFFEKLKFIPKIRDEVALSETIVFGYPLNIKTKYKNIKVMNDGEILSFSQDKVNSFKYWRWDTLRDNKISLKDSTLEAYRIFKESIRIRLREDASVGAFLSGGMDSRAIVGAISDLNIKAYLFNFSPTNSQDHAFASHFANEVGFPFISTPRDKILPQGFRLHLAELTSTFIDENSLPITRERALWSGDGGSVGLGCVHLDQVIAELLRSNFTYKAIKIFTDKNHFHLPSRAFTKEKQSEYVDFSEKTIMEEMKRYECHDPANALFVFLMLNDQRRHLYDFYEAIDNHNLEYQLPFYDSAFLEFILSLPLNFRLNHIFYDEWFKEFPKSVTSVPWQTYPGHIPCPLPSNPRLAYQWGEKKINSFRDAGDNAKDALQGIKIALSPQSTIPLSRNKLLLTSLLHFSGIKNYKHIINASKIYTDTFQS